MILATQRRQRVVHDRGKLAVHVRREPVPRAHGVEDLAPRRAPERPVGDLRPEKGLLPHELRRVAVVRNAGRPVVRHKQVDRRGGPGADPASEGQELPGLALPHVVAGGRRSGHAARSTPAAQGTTVQIPRKMPGKKQTNKTNKRPE
jgi:hypothetical protein